MSLTIVQQGMGGNSNAPAFSAYNSTSQTGITSSTFIKLNFDTEEYDTNSNFASSRFTATIAGYYQFNAAAESTTTSSATGAGCYISFYKNGSRNKEVYLGVPISASAIMGSVSALLYLAANDYIEVYVFQNGAATASTNQSDFRTYFQGCLIRAA